MSSDPYGEFSYTVMMTYWGLRVHDFDRPPNSLGSLISKVTNRINSDTYVILTAQEVADNYTLRDYWTSIVMPAKEQPGFLLHRLKVYRHNVLEIVRNNKAEAHAVHHTLKQIVKNEDWRRFHLFAPDPVPPQGFSADALRTLAEKGLADDVRSIEVAVRARWKFGQKT